MKRKQFLALSTLAPLALIEPSPAQAQDEPTGDEKPVRLKRRKATPTEIREMDAAVEVKPFDISSLPATDRQKALQMADAVNALILKAFLSRKDPANYRLSANPDSLERKVDAIVKTLSPKTLARPIKSPAEARKKLRSLNGIDLKSELTPAVLRLPTRRSLKDTENLDVPRRQVCAFGKYSRLSLILQKVHCAEETDGIGGADEMFLGGLMVGASGSAKTMGVFNLGDFDSGDTHNYGWSVIGSFNLNTTDHYPKDFYITFQLVESDSSDAATVRDLTKLLKEVVDKVLQLFGLDGYSAVIGGILSAVGKFIAEMFGDDYFPTYGIYLRLDNENHFGSDGQSRYLRTQNIHGHGGAYRIGYRWQLT